LRSGVGKASDAADPAELAPDEAKGLWSISGVMGAAGAAVELSRLAAEARVGDEPPRIRCTTRRSPTGDASVVDDDASVLDDDDDNDDDDDDGIAAADGRRDAVAAAERAAERAEGAWWRALSAAELGDRARTYASATLALATTGGELRPAAAFAASSAARSASFCAVVLAGSGGARPAGPDGDASSSDGDAAAGKAWPRGEALTVARSLAAAFPTAAASFAAAERGAVPALAVAGEELVGEAVAVGVAQAAAAAAFAAGRGLDRTASMRCTA